MRWKGQLRDAYAYRKKIHCKIFSGGGYLVNIDG